MAGSDEGSEPRKRAAKKAPVAKKAAPAKKAPVAKKAAPAKKAPVAKKAAPAAERSSAAPIDESELLLPPMDRQTLGRLWSQTFTRYLAGLRANKRRMIISAAVGASFGWLANLIVMARTYDGFVVPPGSTASGQGNVLRGTSFWFVVSMIASAIVNHRLTVGSERFWADIRGFPDTIKAVVRDDAGALNHALFGFAGATLITYTFGPSLSGAVAVGLVVAIGTVLRPLLVGALLIAWHWVVKRLSPQRVDRTPIQTVTVATLGGAAAMALAVVVQGSSTRLILGVGALIAALVLAKRDQPAAGLMIFLLMSVVGVALFLVTADAVYADDGGWRECGSSLSQWWSCSGSDRARWLAVYGAGGSGLGAAIGSGIPPKQDVPVKNWDDLTQEEKERFRQQYIRKYKETHPNARGADMKRFIEGLDAQPPGFFESRWNDVKNFAGAYWDDVASGQQAEGLGAMFLGGYEGFTGAAKSTWDEFKQLPATLYEFPGMLGDDITSGRLNKRVGGMLEAGGKAIDMANTFINMSPEELQAAYDKYGKTAVQGFMNKMGDFERKLQGMSPTEIRQSIGKIAGAAEFEVLLGAAGDKGMGKGMAMSKEALGFLKDARLASKMDDAVSGLGAAAKGIPTPKLSAELLAERNALLAQAKLGDVPLTAEQADRLLGLDQRILHERQATTLQYGEGAAGKGPRTQYKLGDENAVLAKELRTQHPDVWTGKWNPVSDKSYVPGEDAFMSADDLARFKDHPPLPGETVNFTPRKLDADELAQLPPELQSRYNDRVKDAKAWDGHTGFSDRKVVDYSDKKTVEKYGKMYVPEDPGKPVKAAEFWKDPNDNRVYVRYQTDDGVWSAPRRQASDIDTVTHTGGEKLTYEQSRDLQYKQSMGQIGEGDTPAWTRSMLTETKGGFVIKDPEMKDSLYKAIDALHKADGQAVVEQTLDGYVLKTAKYVELEQATQAAKALDAKGLWSPEQRAALVGKGILPR
ncbi:MAG: hypothetical protein JJD92_09930 [Frankiaceae bacterium]|nr:hypothetical protein [Frankiaceae bacterium]